MSLSNPALHNPTNIDHLAPELLQVIFLFAAKAKTAITHVSRRWRRVAIGHSALWTVLSFDLCNRHAAKNIECLTQRAGPYRSLEISIIAFSVDLHSYRPMGPGRQKIQKVGKKFRTTLNLLLPYLKRCLVLHLRSDLTLVLSRCLEVLAAPDAQGNPALRSLRLDWVGSYMEVTQTYTYGMIRFPRGFFDALPCLQVFSLRPYGIFELPRKCGLIDNVRALDLSVLQEKFPTASTGERFYCHFLFPTSKN